MNKPLTPEQIDELANQIAYTGDALRGSIQPELNTEISKIVGKLFGITQPK